MNSLMGRLGAFTVRRRWFVIGAWVVLLAWRFLGEPVEPRQLRISIGWGV